MKYQLGNYVTERSKPGQILTVSEIDLKNMCVIEGYALNEETAKQARILPIEKVSPIPLDAEWLERLQMPDGVFSGNQFFSVAPLTSNPKVYGLYFENEYTGMDFMYVHDLQNFSALTGTQLTTKKDSRRV